MPLLNIYDSMKTNEYIINDIPITIKTTIIYIYINY